VNDKTKELILEKEEMYEKLQE